MGMSFHSLLQIKPGPSGSKTSCFYSQSHPDKNYFADWFERERNRSSHRQQDCRLLHFSNHSPICCLPKLIFQSTEMVIFHNFVQFYTYFFCVCVCDKDSLNSTSPWLEVPSPWKIYLRYISKNWAIYLKGIRLSNRVPSIHFWFLFKRQPSLLKQPKV